MKTYRIDKNLFLVLQPVPKTRAAIPVPQPTNHIVVVDCSGSMTGDLPKLRTHLKSKLVTLLRTDDTLTVIWFSGKGEFGVLVEGQKAATAKDLKGFHDAIDRWLRPIGLTGFKEPLEEVAKVIKRVKNGNPFSLFFMSDGCDNQWPRADILKTVEQATGGLAAAAFVEYGFYADRALLAAMAERAGGRHLFARDFAEYEPVLNNTIETRALNAVRVPVTIRQSVIDGVAFTFGTDHRELFTFTVEGTADAGADQVVVPENLDVIAYLSEEHRGDVDDLPMIAANVNARKKGSPMTEAYAALALFAIRMRPNVVYPILKALADAALIEQFSGCFGKQRYSDFVDKALHFATSPTSRYPQGWDPTKVPDDNAFTVLELLQYLSWDHNNRLLLDSPEFKYSRISRGRVDATEVMTDVEQTRIAEITAEMAKTKAAKKVKELQAELDRLMQAKGTAFTFTPEPNPDGYPIENLTYNEDRPNISVLVKKSGTVDLTGRIPAGLKLPAQLPTHIWRNYAIIRDGLVNVDILPAQVVPTTAKDLRTRGCDMTPVNGVEAIRVHLLPILNRTMVKEASAEDLIRMQWNLTRLRAAQKVLNHFKKKVAALDPKPPATLASTYGEAEATWLKDVVGVTDGGFAPKHTVQAESKDFYLGKELTVKLKGYSSLPTVDEVAAKLKGGKLNGPGALMVTTLEECLNRGLSGPTGDVAWLEKQARLATVSTRQLIQQIAEIKFAIIVGQVWFKEWASLAENTMRLACDGVDILGTIEMKDVEIRV